MNYTVISPKIACNICSHIQWADAKHCSSCGASFVWGQPDAWHGRALPTSSTLLNLEVDDDDDDDDLDFDKCFSDMRKAAKTRKYKMIPIKETPEHDVSLNNHEANQWKLITFVFLTIVVIGLALSKLN